MPLVQLCFSSDGRLAAFPTEKQRRAAVHRLAKVTQGSLVVFGFVLEHGHPVVTEAHERIGPLRRVLRVSLGTGAAAPLEKVWKGDVRNRSHVVALARYLINQTLHHGVPAHPALWSGSCFMDLVGARIVDGLSLRLFELTGLTKEDVMPMVGLPAGCIRPATNAEVRELGATRLKDAASAALAADPALTENDRHSMRARRVVATIAGDAGIALKEVAHVLRCTEGSARKMGKRPTEQTWLQATRRRLALEEMVWKQMQQDWLRQCIVEHAARKNGAKYGPK